MPVLYRFLFAIQSPELVSRHRETIKSELHTEQTNINVKNEKNIGYESRS